MRTLLVAAAVAAASPPAGVVVGVALSTAQAAADEGMVFVPASQKLRRRDFSRMQFVDPRGYGRVTALVGSEGADVLADITAHTMVPNTGYQVRIIQLPRSSANSCTAGDLGVTSGTLLTNNDGAGTVRVQGPMMAGATGVWVSITRPDAHSQVPAEFYTTDFVVQL